MAELAPDGSFALKAANLDYSWVTAKTRNTQMGKALSSDKYVDGYRDQAGTHRGHAGGMNVIFTDRSVRWVKDEELPSETMLPAGLTR